eukprot:CAMPEP_0174271874 /NCGR_PEP_ID=MMETSP0439-20130205/49336_1 /TAXON_ID=0 /ORGANISM="Stereomyxa ramosa, Strain Chinc5" /LENGTH=218 /DNA_ID=CAMNT_0015362127 /DNA_START=250 /DNA_END=903 /DNA_ORIENTATION=+
MGTATTNPSVAEAYHNYLGHLTYGKTDPSAPEQIPAPISTDSSQLPPPGSQSPSLNDLAMNIQNLSQMDWTGKEIPGELKTQPPIDSPVTTNYLKTEEPEVIQPRVDYITNPSNTKTNEITTANITNDTVVTTPNDDDINRKRNILQTHEIFLEFFEQYKAKGGSTRKKENLEIKSKLHYWGSEYNSIIRDNIFWAQIVQQKKRNHTVHQSPVLVTIR